MFVECWHNTVESECLGFQPFVITHFNTIASTFCDWLWWIRMRTRVWRVITHFNTIASTFCDWLWWIRMRTRVWRVGFSILLPLHRSVKLCLSSDEFNLFNALLNEHLLWSFNIFCASKKWLSFTKINFHVSEAILYLYCWCFIRS